MPSEPDLVLLEVTEILERLGLRYAIGGSVAAGFHGFVRSTRDIDILVALRPDRVEQLAAALRPSFYVPEQTMRDAVAAHSCFGVIHLQYHFKVDFFVAGSSRLDLEELAGAQSLKPFAGALREVRVASAEAMVVRKLEWFRRGGGRSDRQWDDVRHIVALQHDHLDVAWMQRAAAELGVSDLLARVLADPGSAPP